MGRDKARRTKNEVRSGYAANGNYDYLSSEYLRDAREQKREVDSLTYIKALCSHLTIGSFQEKTDAEHAALNRLQENAYWMIPYLLQSLEESKARR